MHNGEDRKEDRVEGFAPKPNESMEVFRVGLTPHDDSILQHRIAIPYVTTAPSGTPRDNGTPRVFFDGTDYHFRVYANGAWRTIQFGGASTAARLDASGTTTVGNGATEVKINVDTATYTAVGNATVDTTNRRITVTVAGKYLVIGCIQWSTPTDGERYNAILKVNGSTIRTNNLGHSGSTNNLSVVAQDILDLAANDYVELYGLHSGGANRTANSSGTYLALAAV